jgi:hypothetical protein
MGVPSMNRQGTWVRPVRVRKSARHSVPCPVFLRVNFSSNLSSWITRSTRAQYGQEDLPYRTSSNSVCALDDDFSDCASIDVVSFGGDGGIDSTVGVGGDSG